MLRIVLISSLLFLFSWAGIPMLKTGQTKSYDASGAEVTDGSIKDDGFYTKGQERSYSRNANGVVTDNTTGLQWQDDYSDNADNIKIAKFTSVDNNASAYCGGLVLDGNSDWRLPNIEELISILDFGKYNPAIDTAFVNTASDGYWSSTQSVSDTTLSFYANFTYAVVDEYPKDENLKVMCVRDVSTAASSSFVRDDSKEIVYDSTNNLTWQDNEDVNDTAKKLNWIDAISYCESLSLARTDDWRLPNINELLSITDTNRSGPAISDAFIYKISYGYWTSTTADGFTDSGELVTFNNGGNSFEGKANRFQVRCVRDGEIPQPTSSPATIMYLLD